jgi:hypothetical protein
MLQLQALKDFYNTGSTLPYEFRKKQLQNLEGSIRKYEEEINEAL